MEQELKGPQLIESMAAIAGQDDIEYAEIEGFNPGQKLRIGSLTAGDMIEWSEANEGDAKRTAGLRLICKSLVDKAGNRFAADPKNIAEFRKKPHKASERVVKQILKLNGIRVKGYEDEGDNSIGGGAAKNA